MIYVQLQISCILPLIRNGATSLGWKDTKTELIDIIQNIKQALPNTLYDKLSAKFVTNFEVSFKKITQKRWSNI